MFCLLILVMNICGTTVYSENITSNPDWNKTSTRTFFRYAKNPSETFGGVTSRNIIHVFAFEGDTICLGTNIYHSSLDLAGTGDRKNASGQVDHTDEGSIDIVLHDLAGNLIPIDVHGTPGSKGYIDSYDTEQLAKKMTSPEGNSDGTHNYVPYTYTVSETGIYTIEFHSYSGSGNTNVANDNNKTKGWVDPKTTTTQGGMVASWDVTVFNESGQKKTGRTYADYLALQMNGTMKEQYYILTNDSYIYEMSLLGIAPYTFSFFSNNRGITDAATGNIIYKSVKDLKNNIKFLKFGINYTNPSTDDTDVNKNFYIFFEKPNEDLEGYMYEKAYVPDPAKNLQYIRDEEMYAGMGGRFSFDVESATTATLQIDFNISGKKYKSVEISDVVTPYSTNTFYWDGRDGNGEIIPAGNYTFDQLSYSVTTKAGEIHFPLIDMEDGLDGITVTRVNPVYDKNNNRVDTNGSIYDKTKSVLYYDETAIYYGEKITPNGASEADVTYQASVKNSAGATVTEDKPMPKFTDVSNGVSVFGYRNITSKTSNEYNLYTTYGIANKLRVGDHSSLTNRINYNSDYTSQKAMIDYLDSDLYPVGQSKRASYWTNTDPYFTGGAGGSWSSTTDYAIANYWTFTPATPTLPSNKSNIEIKDTGEDRFNLVARVFYDAKNGTTNYNGIYDPQTDGDHLLNDVTLNLYKKSEDSSPKAGKTYVVATETNGTIKLTPTTNFASNVNLYELVKTAKTPMQGILSFNALEYDKTNGTEYIYEVVRPNTSYTLTSASKTAQNNNKTEVTDNFVTCSDSKCDNKTSAKKTFYYGPYMSYTVDSKATGIEVQKIVVGGPNGLQVDADKNKTISTIDVGYYFDKNVTSLKIKKDWGKATEGETPEIVVFEVSYNNGARTQVYDERALTSALAWSNSYEYLEKKLDGANVTDYYVSAEYYIYDGKIFRHKFDYDILNHVYKSFVGDDYYYDLTKYKEEGYTHPQDKKYTIANIPDFNGDGISNGADLAAAPSWTQALAAGAKPSSTSDVVSPFNSVLDRNIGSAVTEITITNATSPGTVEILKYHDENTTENHLSGATFRLYKGTMDSVKMTIEAYNTAQAEYNNATTAEKEAAKTKMEQALAEVDAITVGSGTTRANGRIAFAGLDPTATYTVRERYAPNGYRMLEEYYQVNPKTATDGYHFNSDNYCLIEIANSIASDELTIRKRMLGRSWQPEDSYEFDLSFQYSQNSSSSDIVIDTTEKTLYSTEETNLEKLITDFVKKFDAGGEKDKITVDYEDEYAVTNDVTSIDTKASENLLVTGNDGLTNASLYGVDFPAAGTYTFKIRENNVSNESLNVEKSPRIFTVTINVNRELLADQKEGTAITLENSHLKASVSRITYQDSLGEKNGIESFTESAIYGGNSPVFTNTYIVENLDQETKYAVKNNFTGRPNNKWLINDSFNYLVSGADEVTNSALSVGNLQIKGLKSTTNEGSSDKTFTITSETANSTFLFKEIDFHSIVFPVTYHKETGQPMTDPVVYTLNIKQLEPEGAVNHKYNGITYDTTTYTLIITLVNAVNEDGETDGIIDKITFDLYKNYNASSSSNTPICTCVFEQTLQSDGTVKMTQQHGENDTHTMTFNNSYSSEVTWSPKIAKKLTGRDWLAGDSFTFTISLNSGDAKGVKIPSKTTATITSNGKGAAAGTTFSNQFEQFTFTKPGTYIFGISENFNGKNGITISSTPYEIIVEAIDDTKGNMSLSFNSGSESIDAGSAIEFVNTYADQENSFHLYIEKTLEGRNWTSQDTFTFLITPNAATKKAISDGILSVPTDWKKDQNNNYTVTVSKSDAQGTITGGVIKKDIGQVKVLKGAATSQVYSFKVEEQVKSLTGIKCSENAISLDITVSRATNETSVPTGNLNIVATYAFSTNEENKHSVDYSNIVLPFKNTAYVKESLVVKNTLVGRDLKNSDTFETTVTLTKGEVKNVVMSDGSEFNGTKKLTFNRDIVTQNIDFEFLNAGTYEFEIVGVIPKDISNSHISYDKTTYQVVVVVEDVEGSLIARSTIKKNGQSFTGNTLEIINFALGDIAIKKEVLGIETNPDREFTFTMTLTPEENATLSNEYPVVGGSVSWAKSGKSLVATFQLKQGQTITITDIPAGVDYTIEEAKSSNYRLEKITKNGKSTEMKANDKIISGDSQEQSWVFSNQILHKLPITGGIGRIIFYIIGGLLIICSIIGFIFFLLYKKRKREEQEESEEDV